MEANLSSWATTPSSCCPTEKWNEFPGAVGYLVSSCGRARSKRFPDRLLKLQRGWADRWCAKLWIDGKTRTVQIHRAVAEAFDVPGSGPLALHRDDNFENNHDWNLYWGTYTENMHDRVRNGIDHNARKTHCPQGHEYDEENTLNAQGRRHCRECGRARYRRWSTPEKERERKRIARKKRT